MIIHLIIETFAPFGFSSHKNNETLFIINDMQIYNIISLRLSLVFLNKV